MAENWIALPIQKIASHLLCWSQNLTRSSSSKKGIDDLKYLFLDKVDRQSATMHVIIKVGVNVHVPMSASHAAELKMGPNLIRGSPPQTRGNEEQGFEAREIRQQLDGRDIISYTVYVPRHHTYCHHLPPQLLGCCNNASR